MKRQETWRVRIRSVMPAVDAIADGQGESTTLEVASVSAAALIAAAKGFHQQHHEEKQG